MQRCTLMLVLLMLVTAMALCQRNQEMIDRVAAGEVQEARASWWGFDAEDATACLQAAIDSGVPRLIVEDMGSPWIVTPLTLVSNQEIVFEEGVELLAKRGEFHGGGDALVTARDVENVTLRGDGATFRMWREDYANPELYTKAEWRHCLQLRGVRNVEVRGLTLAESGGDGIYLGTGPDGATNIDVTIGDVVCDGNYRQGISVITAQNLVIEDSVLRNTHGTWPQAGIDFEPNDPAERLVNIVMRNCVSESNTYGYVVNIAPHNAPTAPVSLRFENCRAVGNTNPGFQFAIAGNADVLAPAGAETDGPDETRIDIALRGCLTERNSSTGYVVSLRGLDGGPDAVAVRVEDCRSTDDAAMGVNVLSSVMGVIDFTDCIFERSGSSGIGITKPADLGRLRFANCRVLDCAAGQASIAPIMFASGGAAGAAVGGVEFDDVLVRDALERPPLGYNDRAGGTPVRDVTGTLIVERDSQRTPVELTEELIARWMPASRMRDIPRLSLEGMALEPLAAELPAVAAQSSPWPLVRGVGSYILYAQAGDEVAFTVRYLQVGPYAGGEMVVVITGPTGDEVHRATAAFKADTTVSFTAPATGLYHFTLNAGNNRSQILAPSHPMALVIDDRPVGLNRSGGRLIFYVPPGTTQFGVRVAGQGTGEGIRATLLDPRGGVFGQVDNQFETHQFEVGLDPPSAGEVWALQLERPSQMTWDDHSVDLRGVPPLLSAAGATPLAPVPQAR